MRRSEDSPPELLFPISIHAPACIASARAPPIRIDGLERPGGGLGPVSRLRPVLQTVVIDSCEGELHLTAEPPIPGRRQRPLRGRILAGGPEERLARVGAG